jgi:septum formation protein
MNNTNTLFLGSKSPSRQTLLKNARIPFVLVSQDADEQVCSVGLTLPALVREIALQKMTHVVLPPRQEIVADVIFVLTADTMVQDVDGRICGKPADYQDAVTMIKSARRGMTLSTAFCIEKRIWNSEANAWDCVEHVVHVVSSSYAVDVPDYLIDWYLKKSISMQCAGGFAIEEAGQQFVPWVNGSPSTIMGLPLYEVRVVLEQLGFFKRD